MVHVQQVYCPSRQELFPEVKENFVSDALFVNGKQIRVI